MAWPATPIDEGDPVYASSTPLASWIQLNGSNFSTATKCLIKQSMQPITEEQPLVYISGSQIHDRVQYFIPNPHASGDLVIGQPIGYDVKVPPQVLQDLINHQAHVGRGRVRVVPTAEYATGTWTPSTGGTFYNLIDSGTHAPDWGEWISTTAPNDAIRFAAYSQMPSNVSKVKEVIVNIWCHILESNTGNGNSFLVSVYHSGGVQFGISKYIAQTPSGTGNFIQVRFQGHDLTESNMNNFEIEIETKRPFGGAAPVSLWKIYELDAMVIYEPDDIDLVDEASFDAIDALYSAKGYYLTGDFFDVGFDEALMNVLSHAPEMFIFVANDSKITAHEIGAYSDTASPYTIGPDRGNFIAVKRSFTVDERVVTDWLLSYNARNLSTAAGSATQNPTNELGYQATDTIDYQERAEEYPADELRELIGDTADAKIFLGDYDDVFADSIDGIEIAMNQFILVPEIGDVVSVDIDKLDINEKKHLVVRKEIDLDNIEGDITLFDKELA